MSPWVWQLFTAVGRAEVGDEAEEEAVADNALVAVPFVVRVEDVDADPEVEEVISEWSRPLSCSLSEPAGTRVASVSPSTQCLTSSAQSSEK